eukprot:TRINITY_DN14913_c0_g1_i1.p1 TRINITY_DN14913_c0_g1~~TRINITY_DN14913_c0_g1_i1.p1  ORF type:complete len:186 (+),score=65.77 TRINITY_DN14913_c0_g1_i1:477-1034(+)
MASTGPVQRTKAQASTSLGASVTSGQSDKPLVQHTFGLPTAPGPNFANTFPMYDVTFTSIDFHRTIGHTINTLILLLPTLYYWHDPRWKFVLLAKLTLPEAVWEQATHFFTRQLHNVHKLKIVPLLVLDAIFFANGGAQQVLSGPRDGLYYFMFYYFVVFMGGNLVEAFITFFGKLWPIKAPDSV